jgi:tetratricopeptide (TPR) repeat protein
VTTDLTDAIEAGATLAEVQGWTEELGEAIARLAEAELAAGRLETAKAVLEGLVVTNPKDGQAWTLLSRAHRRLGQPLAARFCADVAVRLVPADARARLARAEALLATPGEQREARADLVAIEVDDEVGPRARALLMALPPP